VTESPPPAAGLPLSPAPCPLITVPNGREALAHLAAAWYNYPSRKLRVVGVTGTDGKTTTCTLAASILGAAGHTVGTITTVSARIGNQEVDTGFHTTTPDALDVQRYLAQMVETGAEYAVIEATSHGLAQHRLDAVDFDVAAVTNITHEHLDIHKSWENYRDAKARLFHSLATAHRKSDMPKVAVLNADDNARGVFEHLRQIPAEERVVYSANSKFEIQDSELKVQGSVIEPRISNFESPISSFQPLTARDVEHSAHGLRFAVTTPRGELPIESPLIGRYNVSNILAAVAIGIACRVPFEAIHEGVKAVRVIGRMQMIDRGQPFTAIVDFAHTPNALQVALETAREISSGRVIVVFGCAGLRDVAKRAWMGEIAGKLADRIVVTAEDPRTESLEAINAQIAEGLERAGRRRGEDYFVVADRAEAIVFAVKMARPGDWVIVTGKGHEKSMCFGTTETPWSDQEALAAALERNRAES
jgi:UDP-N-acetylmuramoyl-L-alanyl-D-glutamate--2,6-diaminopimelate ligase